MGTEKAVEILHVPATVHGRVLYETPAEPTALLVGFHGYAQLGEDALAYLRPLAEGRSWAIAAPQALHPFYRPKDQAVVAGWMTRLDRELALEDNVAYTTRAVAELRARMPTAQRLAIVGFSQGVAMAYRTAARCGGMARTARRSVRLSRSAISARRSPWSRAVAVRARR